MLIKKTAFVIFVSLFFSACTGGNVESPSSDAVTQTSSSLPSGGENHSSSSSALLVDSTAALKIIEQYCTNCHFGLHKSWLEYDSDDAWRLAQGCPEK